MILGRVRGCTVLAGALLMLALAGCTQAPRPTAAAPPSQSAASISGKPVLSDPAAGSAVSAASSTASSRTVASRTAPRSAGSSGAAPSSAGSSVRATAGGTATSVRTPASRPTAGPANLPLAGDTGSASQAVTVIAPASGTTQARLQAWNRTAGGWVRYGPEVTAWLGSAGLTSNAREGFSGTPMGSFTLTHAFGNYVDPGTKLPYFHADPDDWWSGDSSSPTYNTHQRCAPASCAFRTDESENLYQAGSVYGYAVVIDYNTAPVVAGKGSAFFLHLTQNQPTEGCVSIPQDELVRIMRWLDPSRHPRIIIGLG